MCRRPASLDPTTPRVPYGSVADGWSANTIDDNPGYLAYGPYTTAVAAGAHVALFRLLVDNHTANNAPIVTLDVVDATERRDERHRLRAREHACVTRFVDPHDFAPSPGRVNVIVPENDHVCFGR